MLISEVVFILDMVLYPSKVDIVVSIYSKIRGRHDFMVLFEEVEFCSPFFI